MATLSQAPPKKKIRARRPVSLPPGTFIQPINFDEAQANGFEELKKKREEQLLKAKSPDTSPTQDVLDQSSKVPANPPKVDLSEEEQIIFHRFSNQGKDLISQFANQVTTPSPPKSQGNATNQNLRRMRRRSIALGRIDDTKEQKSEQVALSPPTSRRSSEASRARMLVKNTKSTDGAPKKKKKKKSTKKRKVPKTKKTLAVMLHRYLAMLCSEGNEDFAAEKSLSRIPELDGILKWDEGRVVFAKALDLLLESTTSLCVSTDGFEVLLLLLNNLLRQVDITSYSDDWKVVRSVMQSCSKLYRIDDRSNNSEFIQAYLVGYPLWSDLTYWKKCLKDEVSKQIAKELNKQTNSGATTGPGSRVIPREVLASTVLCSYVYYMHSWQVPLEIVEKFVANVCKSMNIDDDRKQPILEALKSFFQENTKEDKSNGANEMIKVQKNETKRIQKPPHGKLDRSISMLIGRPTKESPPVTEKNESKRKKKQELEQKKKPETEKKKKEGGKKKQEAAKKKQEATKKKHIRKQGGEKVELKKKKTDKSKEKTNEIVELQSVDQSSQKDDSKSKSKGGPSIRNIFRKKKKEQSETKPIQDPEPEQPVDNTAKTETVTNKPVSPKKGTDVVPSSPRGTPRTEKEAKEQDLQDLMEGLQREVSRGVKQGAQGNTKPSLANSGGNPESENLLKKREIALQELFSTEKSYVDSLEILQEIYTEPLAKVLSDTEFKTLFWNVKDIAELNTNFYLQLKERVDRWKNLQAGDHVLGDLLLRVFPFMRLYASYCENFLKASKMLLDLTAHNTKFAQILEKGTKYPICKGLDLPSYLIMPVQRVPRYKLLIVEILKYTPNTHPDYKNIQKALEVINTVASYVNNTRGENLNKIISIQMNFGQSVSLIQPWRVWITDRQLNVLVVTSSNSDTSDKRFNLVVKPIHMYLFNDILVYSKGVDHYIGQFPLATSWIRDCNEGIVNGTDVYPFSFQIYSPGVVLTLMASHLEEKMKWLTEIAQAINDVLEATKIAGTQRAKEESLLRKVVLGPDVNENEVMTPFLPLSVETRLTDQPSALVDAYINSPGWFGLFWGKGQGVQPQNAKENVHGHTPNGPGQRPKRSLSVYGLKWN